MTPTELLDSLRSIDAELHSHRITAFYRNQPADTRRRFVGMRAYIAQALADATHAHLADLATALEQNDAALQRGFTYRHPAALPGIPQHEEIGADGIAC